MKKVIFIFLSIIIITGCSNKENAGNSIDLSKYDELFDKVANIEKYDDSSLKKEIDDLKKEINSLKSEINNANESSVNSDINDLKSKYNSLQSKYNNLSNENDNLKKEISNLKKNDSDIHQITFDGKVLLADYEWVTANAIRPKYIEYEHYSMLVHNGNEIKSYFPLSIRINSPASKKITYQSLASAVKTLDIPEGKELDSWHTKKECQGEKYDFSTVINLDKDITLYPCYKDAPVVTPEASLDSND